MSISTAAVDKMENGHASLSKEGDSMSNADNISFTIINDDKEITKPVEGQQQLNADDDDENESDTTLSQHRYCVKYGKTIWLCGTRTPSPSSEFPSCYCYVGSDWPCMLVTFSIIIIPSILVSVMILPSYHWSVQIAVIVITMATLVVFSLIACRDPGVVFYDTPVEESTDSVTCAQCQLRRPRGAMHCYDCQVCVDELDHHCPWTGKCIGKKTLKAFYAFLLFITLELIIVAGIAIYYFLRDSTSRLEN